MEQLLKRSLYYNVEIKQKIKATNPAAFILNQNFKTTKVNLNNFKVFRRVFRGRPGELPLPDGL